jgi:hypothetical protein
VAGVTVSASKNGLTSIFGGGVDLKLNKHVSLRLVQPDWVYYHFGRVGSISSTNSAGNFKAATGVVFNFAGK